MIESAAHLLQPLAPVGPGEIEHRPDWNNAGRVNIVMSNVVMTFDVIEVHRLGDARLLVEIAQIAIEVRVIDDASDVTFEVSVIDRIKPN